MAVRQPNVMRIIHGPAGFPKSAAPIAILKIHKKTVIEPAHRVHRGLPDKHRRTHYPIHRLGAVMREIFH